MGGTREEKHDASLLLGGIRGNPIAVIKPAVLSNLFEDMERAASAHHATQAPNTRRVRSASHSIEDGLIPNLVRVVPFLCLIGQQGSDHSAFGGDARLRTVHGDHLLPGNFCLLDHRCPSGESAAAIISTGMGPRPALRRVLDHGNKKRHTVGLYSQRMEGSMKTQANKPNPVFAAARQRLSQRELARLLEVSPRTVARWENGETPITGVLLLALRQIVSQADTPTRSRDFTFIDLFAGIGGTRLGFEAHGGGCVFTSEWDAQSQKTYSTNFKDQHPIAGDIHLISAVDVPDHDVLVAGFPCQPFSIAGVSKKNALGAPHGFACRTQGTLFFEIARIISEKRPQAFVLENVKNLERHDKGRTFSVIMETLQSQLGYHVSHQIIDAKPFVPQHRERVFIVGFREPTQFDWQSLRVPTKHPNLAAILHPQDGSEQPEEPYTVGVKAKVAAKYTLTDHLWNYLQRYAEKHRAKGNGFGFGLVEPDGTTRTLSARYYKDGSEILIYQGKRKNPRRLTPRECARLMGFPDSYAIPVSDTQAYKQFGNSVVVPVVAAVAKEVARTVVSKKRALA